MTLKWTKKDAIECITTLTNPFEKLGLKQGKSDGFNLIEKLKQLRGGKINASSRF